MPTTSSDLPSWFQGVWTREWIDRKGVRSDRFDVRFLQTPTPFADIRIPRDRPALARASSFAELSDADLRSLAKQRAFTGTTSISGDLATWHREIDFQPPVSAPDVGRLERIDDTHIYEHATDGSYTESWRSLDGGAGRFLALRVAHAGRLEQVLLVAGDHFLYVRNRRIDLPAAESLDSLIASTRATRAQIIDYLDCEFSAGRVASSAIPWEIQRSTLPWREGKHLDFVDGIALSDSGMPVPREKSSNQWSVPVNSIARAELHAMFSLRP